MCFMIRSEVYMKLSKSQLKKLRDVYDSKPVLKYVMGLSFEDWIKSYKDCPNILRSLCK